MGKTQQPDQPSPNNTPLSPVPHNDTSSETLSKESPWKSYIALFSSTYVPWQFSVGRMIGTLGAIGAGACLPLMAVIFGGFVNDFNGWGLGTIDANTFKRSVGKNALYLVWLFIARFGCDYIAVVSFHVAASQTCRELRLRYMRSVMNQKMEYFDQHSAASVSTRLTGDVNLIEVGLGEKVTIVMQGTSMLVSSFIIGFIKQWKITLVCITVIPWTITSIGGLSNIDAKIEVKIKNIYSFATGIANEALASPQNILALGASDKMVARFKVYIDKGLDLLAWRGPLISSIYGNMFFSMHCCYALALYMGVKLVNSGEVKDEGTVMTVMFCAILASSSLGLIAPSLPDGIKAAGAAKSVLSILNQHKDIGEQSENQNTSECKDNCSGEGNIKLSNISFAYPTRSSMPVLSNLSLEAPAGKMTAIVGPSGSGKSTIIALLERWYDAAEGEISLDGRDIKCYKMSNWRSLIGLVQQDPVLFDDTIFQNILNGFHSGDTTTTSLAEQERLVTEACIKADAHNFITDLPDGYHTQVGERATFLSGGQKQRIAIARAIISDPKLLFLDEATSALDSESEKLVQKALETACEGRTTITIVHHLATIQQAAKIIVLDKGRVVEEGTHETLSSLGGMYCQLLQAHHAGSSPRSGGLPQTSGEGRDATRRGDGDVVTRIQTSHSATETGEGAGKDEVMMMAIDDPAISRNHSMFWAAWKLMVKYPGIIPTFISALIVGLVASAAFPVTAYLFSKLVTVFQLVGQANFVSRGNFWSLMFFFLALSELMGYGVTFYLFYRSSVKASRRYRPEYMSAMLRQDVGFFSIPGHSSGALVTLLFTDPEHLEGLMGQNLGLIHIYLWDIVACFVLSLVVYWKLALVAIFGGFPVILFAGIFTLKLDMGAADRCERNFLESARFGSEAISSIKTVRALMLEETMLTRYQERLDKAVERSNKQSLLYFIVYAFSDCADLLVMALIFWYGGNLLADFELSVQDYFIIYSAILFGGQSAAFAFGFTTSLAKSQTAGNRIMHLTATLPFINSTTGISPATLPPSDTAIEFKHVNFHYPNRPERSVLRNVSFLVKPGQSTCLVGRSGCGKSTILSLIERFFDPVTGAININGTKLKDLDIAEHRAQCSFVGQETALYQGTIRENLLLGVAKPGVVLDTELEQACDAANIHQFITSLPQGYHTDIGPGGSSLSGGQRQRLAIARALLRQPDILLLDEATSALDAENERMVGEAIARAGKGRTVLAATHHVEAMKRADRVVVMEKGCVVEDGSFEELSRREGGWLWKLKWEGEMR